MIPDVSSADVRALATTHPQETSFMRYFASKANGSRPRPERLQWTPLEAIAPLFVAAAIKGEDPRFFQHHGIDWRATARKTLLALRGRYAGGASTITQQLARNLYLTPARSMVRKLREMRLALMMERALPKMRILELYLNLIEFGPEVWGCAAASDYYFGRAPADLDLFESTFLIVVLPAPKTGLSGAQGPRCFRRQRLLANRLFLSGLVDAETCAVCLDRVQRLHALLARGTTLPVALSSVPPDGAGDTAFLQTMAAALGVAPVPPGDPLASRCGFERERRVFDALAARYGENARRRFLLTGNIEALKPRQPL